ncbi:unnamed protein product [Amoebophrya sp. A120]|nr:unnamed protein product [Amoebophrya sp. A120]|eukprot:GSA120T00007311001.1
MYVSDIVIPTRFLTTSAQLIFCITLLQDRAPYVLTALPKASRNVYTDDYASFDAEFQAALVLAIICGLFEVSSMVLVGSTVLLNRHSFIQTLLHFSGVVSIMVFGLNGDSHFDYFWYILFVFCIIPSLLEVGALMYLHYTKVHGNYF